MIISALIRTHAKHLATEFADFAQTLPRRGRTPLAHSALADSIHDLLEAIAEDLGRSQSAAEQFEKSHGRRPEHAPTISAHARQHALTRLDQGFALPSLLAEFRALRASLNRLVQSIQPRPSLEDLVRLNEALDQAITDSIALFTEEVERARELLIGILGHDLRNPLNAVSMSAEVLLANEHLPDEVLSLAARVKNSSARMARMIEDLIDFARTQMGTRLPTSQSRVELIDVVKQVVDEIQAAHPSRELVYSSHTKIVGEWDQARLAQLFSNLIGNAVQHGEVGRPVQVSVTRHDAFVKVGIHNEGPPIGLEAVEKIFEPLMRAVVKEAERRNNQPGIGLGLYVAREIAKAHGGSIEVRSSAQEGTTFTVTLPVSS